MSERVAIVERFYHSFCDRDWDALRSLLSPDVEFSMGGRSSLAGYGKGADDVVGMLQELVNRSEGTFGPVMDDSWDVCASDDHVILLEYFGAKRGDEELKAYLYVVFAIADGFIVRLFAHSSEQYEFDAFFAAPDR